MSNNFNQIPHKPASKNKINVIKGQESDIVHSKDKDLQKIDEIFIKALAKANEQDYQF